MYLKCIVLVYRVILTILLSIILHLHLSSILTMQNKWWQSFSKRKFMGKELKDV